jgi:transcriptional regulator with XRE-family HTH domain
MAATKKTSKAITDFGSELAQMRELRALTQADACIGANLALSTLSKQERTKICHLRASKLRSLANYYHSVSRLTARELEILTQHGSLFAGYEPEAPAATRLPISNEIRQKLERQYAGRIRAACELVHTQILGEASAAAYLPLILSAAESLGVSITIEPPTR